MCAKDNGTDYDTVVIGASHARASSDPGRLIRMRERIRLIWQFREKQ